MSDEDTTEVDVPDESAMLLFHADGSVELYTPTSADDEFVPQHVMLAGACLIMANQPQEVIGTFIDSMMEAAASSTG